MPYVRKLVRRDLTMDRNTFVTASFKINNLKSSARLNTILTLDEIKTRAIETYGFRVRDFTTFIVIRDPGSSLRYILFKSKEGGQGNHLNLTGVSDFESEFCCFIAGACWNLKHCFFTGQSKAIEKLAKIVQCSAEDIDLTTDNLSASSDKIYHYLRNTNRGHINLRQISDYIRNKHPDLSHRLNLEVFSALVLKIENLTLLLYASGKVSSLSLLSKASLFTSCALQICVVGGKTTEGIRRALEWTHQIIRDAITDLSQ